MSSSSPRQPATLTADLHGRVAVVTGASSGLGERFTRVLAESGAKVFAAARRIDRLRALETELELVTAAPCDVAVEDDCARLIHQAAADAGRVDILVNCAGTGDVVAAEDEPVELFRQVVDVNLIGLFMMCQQAGRVMLAQGSGSIINVSSALGLVASAPIKQAAYCATKGAVINLTRELSVQWGRRGVRVNALAPGWFRSEMTGDMFDDEKGQDFIVRNTPLARPGAPDELDGALLFLASDASSYVIGQTITVDGGWTTR